MDSHLPVHRHEAAIRTVLQEHGSREGEALAAYQSLVEECDDPPVRYLANVIMEDERRHHAYISEMLHRIESFLWDVDVEPQVLDMPRRSDPALRKATEELLRLERDDAKALKTLRRTVKSEPSSSLLPLLVEVMIHDTAKHIAILKVIKSHTSG